MEDACPVVGNRTVQLQALLCCFSKTNITQVLLYIFYLDELVLAASLIRLIGHLMLPDSSLTESMKDTAIVVTSILVTAFAHFFVDTYLSTPGSRLGKYKYYSVLRLVLKWQVYRLGYSPISFLSAYPWAQAVAVIYTVNLSVAFYRGAGLLDGASKSERANVSSYNMAATEDSRIETTSAETPDELQNPSNSLEVVNDLSAEEREKKIESTEGYEI